MNKGKETHEISVFTLYLLLDRKVLVLFCNTGGETI